MTDSRRTLKRASPFLIFITVLTVVIGSILIFIQSKGFAGWVKALAAKTIPKDIGIEVDFSEFAIQLFPPGLSVIEPRLEVKRKNALGLPEGASVTAKRMELNFRYLQMFNGKIRVHQVRVEGGRVQVVIDTESKPQTTASARSRLRLRWEDLFEIRADEFQVVDTELTIQFLREKRSVSALARNLKLGQETRGGLPGYRLEADVAGLSGDFLQGLKLPTQIDESQASAWVGISGAQLENFSVNLGGAKFKARGTIQGNLLLPIDAQAKHQLLVDVKAEANGGIPQILQALGIPLRGLNVSGQVQSQLQIKGDLVHPLDTIGVQGAIELSDLGFKQWQAKHASLDAVWSADPKGGTLELKKFLIESPEIERQLPHGVGSGGVVRILPGAWKLSEIPEKPISLGVEVERAHLHWFLGPAVRDVYPLSFRFSGKIQASLQLPKNTHSTQWSVSAELSDARAIDFILDNQRLGIKKDQVKILDIPLIRLHGPLRVDQTGVHMLGTHADLEHSRFVANGVVDFKKGFDFKAGGDATLSDVGTIAEVPIVGQGIVWSHIHGPSDRVMIDFDADLHGARYLNLNLGSVKGRMTWDDGPSRFLIRNVQALQNESRFLVDGAIDLSGPGLIDVSVLTEKASTRDLVAVFDPMVAGISWFPRTLEGSVRGGAKISGGVGKNQLSVLAQLQGANWAYAGETARSVRLEGGLDKGTLFARNVVLNKRDGQFMGAISFGMDTNELRWQTSAVGVPLTDFDHVAGLDIPLRGNVRIDSEGAGKLGNIKSQTAVDLSGLVVRGLSYPDSRIGLYSKDRSLNLDAQIFGAQAQVQYSYDFKPGGASRAEFKLDRLDFSPVLLILNSELMQDGKLAGWISAQGDLKFASGQFDRASGTLLLSEHYLRTQNWELALQSPLSIKVQEGSFTKVQSGWKSASHDRGGSQQVLQASLSADRGALDGVLQGRIDLGLLTVLSSSIRQSGGVANIDLAIRGRLSDPDWFGKTQIEGGAVRLSSLDNPIESIRGGATMKSGLITIQKMDGDLAGGKVNAAGKVDLFTDRFPEIDVRIGINRSKIKIYPFQYMQTTGTLHIAGEDAPYRVTGELVVDAAISREKMFGPRSGASGSKAVPYAPPPKGGNRRTSSWFDLDFRVAADGGLLVQNDLFDAEAKADLRVVGSIEAPRLLGNVEAIQGKMSFKERSFQIRSGSIAFNSTAAIDPIFAFNAGTDVGGTKVQLVATGKIDQFKIELSSNPAMPESEILNLLALGFTSSDARKLNPAERANLERSEAVSLVLHSLDFNRELKNKSGLQLQVDEAVNPQQGTSVFRPSNQIDTSVSPKLVIKKQVEVFSRPVTISAGSTVGVGANVEREVNAEARLTPSLSLSGVVNSREIPILQNSQVSFGGDLKFQWRLR